MNETNQQLQAERQMLREARAKGKGELYKTYAKLSGPGWLQSAITLGGGSLAGSLYLGVLGGFTLLWLQPLMMIFGVVMLSSIAYVALSTGERPFQAIKDHVNPVLAWGWAIATLLANVVWCLPQFALGTAAVQQNLLPGLEGNVGKGIICAGLLLAASVVVWFYDSGSKGIKIFETILKIMVGVVVICFFGVIFKMGTSAEGLPWGAILSGFIPDFSLLTKPADSFNAALAATGEFASFWANRIVNEQRDVMITAAATAVGINMTFLLPYSMLKKGWDREFRGLAIFDLSTGLFIPFVLATSCVVLAAAAQFHSTPQPGVLEGAAPAGLIGQYNSLLSARLKHQIGAEEFAKLSADEVKARVAALPEGDKRMAAMLVKRDAFNLAQSLEKLTGPVVGHYVFGIGVLGMALSTIIILMLISGFTVCEIFNLPHGGFYHRLGCFLPALGVLGPFFWTGKTQFWLAVPTSIFGMTLLPIAYLTFFLMMNSKSLMGGERPQGNTRAVWNVLMLLAVGLAAFGSGWSILSRTEPVRSVALTLVGIFVLLVIIAHFTRKPKTPHSGGGTRANKL